MAKDRIDRAGLGDAILALTQNAPEGADPLREMAEMLLNSSARRRQQREWSRAL